MIRRLRLRRSDGNLYLERWGLAFKRIGGVYLHRMTAPDPGLDLHDHPWTFVTIPLVGAYTEHRAPTATAVRWAQVVEEMGYHRRGLIEVRSPLRPRRMRLDECHRIVQLHRKSVWTLVFIGPKHRDWGFYTPSGFVLHGQYGQERRDMWTEVKRG